MKKLLILTLVVTSMVFCKIPDWFINQPKSDNKVIFVTGTGESSDLKYAIRKAGQDARLNIAKALKARVSTISGELFMEEKSKSGKNKQNNATKMYEEFSFESVDEIITNSIEVKKYVDEPNSSRDTYMAYALYAYKAKELASLMTKNLKKMIKQKPEIKKSLKKEVQATLETSEKSSDDWILDRLKDYED